MGASANTQAPNFHTQTLPALAQPHKLDRHQESAPVRDVPSPLPPSRAPTFRLAPGCQTRQCTNRDRQRGFCARQVIRVVGKIVILVTNRIGSTAAALLFLGCLVTLTSAFNLPNRSPVLSSQLAFFRTTARPGQQHTMLTLADRVAYQRAIEEVYWRHRIWPKERPDAKPSLDEMMPPEQLEKKVEEYLRASQALQDYWQKPISAEQLQAEMERMAQHTKQPEVLHELFKALGNDPFVIAECLAGRRYRSVC